MLRGKCVTVSRFRGFDLPLTQQRADWDSGHQGWYEVCRFTYRGCNCQRGVCVIQEAGLGNKNDEKKDSLPDLWPFFPPSGSLSCSFTTHQTLLYLLDTEAPDQNCIVVFFFSPGRLLKEVVLKTGAFWPVITHICAHVGSHSPCSPPAHLSVG